ncbi:MAG: hypothetical protein N2171_06130 [Clostridia bacterium]|nr:hypothetical protein [Clostridia bacterium]
MLKKLMAIMLVFMFAVSVPIVASAYSDTLPGWVTGNTDSLIYIKRPESHWASTSDKTYTISAVGAEGTYVAVYKYDASSDTYYLVKGATQIGASGLYSVVVDLTDDSNVFCVYAWNDWATQPVQISINKIKKSTVDKLKGITVTIRNFF